MKFPRQEYWSGLPFRSLEDLPNPGIELRYPGLNDKLQKLNQVSMILESEYNPLELKPLWIYMCNLSKMLFMHIYII